ncbi:hypothetical protein GC175_12160 [bacterium]|nr:hypothetical protein [bacterium]
MTTHPSVNLFSPHFRTDPYGGFASLRQQGPVAYSWDGTTNRLYIDGKEVQSTTTAPTGGSQGLGIGLEGNGASPWNGFLCQPGWT